MSLTRQNYIAAATVIGCDVPMIEAFDAVESQGDGFNADGSPKILFERHLFWRFTHGAFPVSDINNPVRGGYGKSSQQHNRLQRAAALNRNAALRSASWGRYQILGDNWQRCGFKSLQGFINAMYKDESEHLRAFVAYILSDPALVKAMRSNDFDTCARLYNGPAYAEHNYQGRLRDAFIAAGGRIKP